MKWKLVLLVACVTVLSIKSFSQGINQFTLLPYLDFQYLLTYEELGEQNNQQEELYSRVCNLTLTDTTNISAIHIMVGSERDTSDILMCNFSVYKNNVLPVSQFFTRSGFDVRIGLFKTTSSDMYHYEVWLEDMDGRLSERKYFY